MPFKTSASIMAASTAHAVESMGNLRTKQQFQISALVEITPLPPSNFPLHLELLHISNWQEEEFDTCITSE